MLIGFSFSASLWSFLVNTLQYSQIITSMKILGQHGEAYKPLVAHLATNWQSQMIILVVPATDGDPVPVPHFGLAMSVPDFHALAERVKAAGIKFVIEPHIRFVGQPGEQVNIVCTTLNSGKSWSISLLKWVQMLDFLQKTLHVVSSHCKMRARIKVHVLCFAVDHVFQRLQWKCDRVQGYDYSKQPLCKVHCGVK